MAAQPWTPDKERYSITWGETAIVHVGGPEIGGRRAVGFSVAELNAIAASVRVQGGVAELVPLHPALPDYFQRDPALEAATLVIRDGVDFLFGAEGMADTLLNEQRQVLYDDHFFGHGSCKRKLKRHNIVFGDVGVKHSADYSQPTVVAFDTVPFLEMFRGELAKLGPKAAGLFAEGNHYNHEKSGIGYHGDGERKTVICCSLGASMRLRYHWRLPGSSEHALPPVDLTVNHGDVYIMSEKATGWDWTSRSRVRLVHAAGHDAK